MNFHLTGPITHKYLIASPIVRADLEVSIVFDRFRSSGLNHQVPPPEGSEESKGFYSYDLYAVCNHHGSDLQGGHYTATCRNPTDGHWYLFDDNHVQKLDADREVVTEEAYILFYQRYASTFIEQIPIQVAAVKRKKSHTLLVGRLDGFSAKLPVDQAFYAFPGIQGS